MMCMPRSAPRPRKVPEVYSRGDFEIARSGRKAVERREGGILAGLAVGFGIAQLALLRWLEAQPAVGFGGQVKPIAGTVFVAYAVLVAWLLVRYQRRLRRAALACPQCGRRLAATSERIALATGNCDGCGGRLLVDGGAA
jgi:membrane protein implicated in regulation of membrane protease activity